MRCDRERDRPRLSITYEELKRQKGHRAMEPTNVEQSEAIERNEREVAHLLFMCSM